MTLAVAFRVQVVKDSLQSVEGIRRLAVALTATLNVAPNTQRVKESATQRDPRRCLTMSASNARYTDNQATAAFTSKAFLCAVNIVLWLTRIFSDYEGFVGRRQNLVRGLRVSPFGIDYSPHKFLEAYRGHVFYKNSSQLRSSAGRIHVPTAVRH